MRVSKLLLPLIPTILLLLSLHNQAEALQLKVGSGEANPGAGISVDISVSEYDQERIAAASFSLIYNSEYLTLTGIDSDFFDTFQNQWLSLNPVPDPLPPTHVEVDGQIFNQPLLFNTLDGMTLVVGASVQARTLNTLFTLHFMISETAPAGNYPISVSPIIINNTAAGYSAAGEALPILVGAIEGELDPALAYPIYSPSIVNGAITVQTTGFIDTDTDGIADSWEIQFFGDLASADRNSDFDGDGSSDLQEYLIADLDPHTDPTVPDVRMELITGMNLVSIPLLMNPSFYASDLLTDWAPALVSVSRIDTTTQTVEKISYNGGIYSGDDFVLVPDEGYDMTMAQTTEKLLTGDVGTNSVNLVTGINLIGFMAPPAGYSAYQLLQDIGNSAVVVSVQRFNRSTGLFEVVAYQDGHPVGPDFAITRSEGYFVTMRQDVNDFVLP